MLNLLASLILFASTPQVDQANAFMLQLNTALTSGVRSSVEDMFARKEDSTYLMDMAQRRGGLRLLKLTMIPAPPGWEKEGPYWAVLSARQDIEDDHDTIYPVIKTMDGLRLGKEVSEAFPQSYSVQHSLADAVLYPKENKISLITTLNLKHTGTDQAPVFRLNVNYEVGKASVDGKTVNVQEAGTGSMLMPKDGDMVRAGGLLIYWSVKPANQMSFTYSGVVNSKSEDKIDEKACYVTAWWIPTIGRLPHTSTVRVQGPKDWVIVSEGNKASNDGFDEPLKSPANYQTVIYHCSIPISYPKIIGGLYKVAAEMQANGRTYRSYQFEPVDKDRGTKDVLRMASAAQFFSGALGEFPFDSYACFDADTYYGIESYSYTLLNYRYTSTFVSHEMGHTYFGGLVPCSYTKDTWNESLTQYVDSVLFDKNLDRTLQMGVATRKLKVPLNKMSIAHEFNSASYYRGAYVMRMLENEIGLDAILKALKKLVASRRGQDTTWADLRAYFEESSGQNLDWFWKQWIENATFPKIEALDAVVRVRGARIGTDVTVKQSGTPDPFRLRFKVILRNDRQTSEQVITMSAPQTTTNIKTDFEPTQVTLEPFEYALVDVGAMIPVRR